MSRKTFWLILAALAAMRLLLMVVTPVFDPSEARYATLAANMARDGDFVVPHFTYQGEYQSFDGKPPLVFQAGGLACRALGVDAAHPGNRFALQFAVRLFPFLSAVLLLFLVHLTVRRKTDEETARLAVVITATSVAFYAAAGLSMTDMTLTCCVAGSLLLYWAMEKGSWPMRAGIAALLGAGMIVKGPVALVMFGLPVFADACVNRAWGKFLDWRWLVVAPVFCAVAVPWFVMVERHNPGSVWYFFYNENFLRFVTHDYGDKYGAGREKFRGVAVVWAFVATLPWALLWPLRRFDWKNFLFLSFAAITLFWCLTSRVLLYYLFPMIPLFAAWLAIEGRRDRILKAVRPAVAIALVGLAGALVGGMMFSDKMQGADTPDFKGYLNRYSHEFYHGK